MTVQVFPTTLEAHAARTKLESEGIEAFLADEHTLGANPGYSIAMGGVRLQVHPADFERAEKVLREESKLEPGDEGEPVPDPRFPLRRCPSCGSEDVNYDRFSHPIAALTWLVLNFPLPWLKRTWNCRSCGHNWKTK
jgi:hypothetical protein